MPQKPHVDHLSWSVEAPSCPDFEKARLSRRGFLMLGSGLGAGVAGGLLAGEVGPRAAGAADLEYRNRMPDRMTYRRLGKTNMMVSAVSLGASANYGEGQAADDDPAAYRAMLERLVDLGVNYFDTSTYDYSNSGGYETEDDFACLCTSANRNKVFISTKVDKLSLTRASVEASLERMRTDHVDLVYVHNARGVSGQDYSAAMSCFDVLDELIREGKVRFKGMTAHSIGKLTGLLQRYSNRVDAIMGFYAATNNYPYASGSVAGWEALYELARSKDVGVVGMKVLLGAAQPWSTRASNLRNDPVAWERIRPFIDADCTVPQACIRWALSNQNVHTAVLGIRTVAEAKEDLAAAKP